nr:uncharacterized protein LOC118967601 [Manis javanica]
MDQDKTQAPALPERATLKKKKAGTTRTHEVQYESRSQLAGRSSRRSWPCRHQGRRGPVSCSTGCLPVAQARGGRGLWSLHSPETQAEGTFTPTHERATPVAGGAPGRCLLALDLPAPGKATTLPLLSCGCKQATARPTPRGATEMCRCALGGKERGCRGDSFPSNHSRSHGSQAQSCLESVHGEARCRHHRASSPPSLQQVVEKASRTSRPLQLPASASPRRSLLPRAIWSLPQGF